MCAKEGYMKLPAKAQECLVYIFDQTELQTWL